MSKCCVLFNPLAGGGKTAGDVQLLGAAWDGELELVDMTGISDFRGFLGGLDRDSQVIIAGGDGTLNRFANAAAGIPFEGEIYYFPTGTGNDFAREFGRASLGEPFPIGRYLKNLPTVEVRGKTYRFINGIGFGIDGYCCQVGDELRKIPGRKVNYTGIAIKGLLRSFDARDARVTVDGREYSYKKVWIAPTMHGKYYGGGMIPAPEQDRENKDGTLSLMLFHGAGRLRTLCAFPGIFKGEHIKHTEMVALHTGHEITVEFDRPTPLQIDGETILDVTRYTARSAVLG